MLKISKDTRFYISISDNPGNFGTVFFNALFQKLSIDALYKAFRVEAGELAGAIAGIRALGISGAGVSMPHKREVIKYLDRVDETARKIGAVNTIVNRWGTLWGYNTDYVGVKTVLREIFEISKKKVLIVGAGGMARAVALALKNLKVEQVVMTNRNSQKGRNMALEFGLKFGPYAARGETEADILVNATSVGMSVGDGLIMPEKVLRRFETIVDVIVSRQKTELAKMGEKFGLQVISGVQITSCQAAAQFKLYTGFTAPKEMIESAVNSYYSVDNTR